MVILVCLRKLIEHETDSICDYFFTTSKNANNHLINSGISLDKIFLLEIQ